MNVECKSEVQSHPDAKGNHGPLYAHDVRDWVAGVPDGAVVEAVFWDYGNQRDPDVRLIGLRAAWSEQR